MIVISIVLLVLIFIGLIRIKLNLCYDKKFSVSVSVLEIRFGADGKKGKPKKHSQEEKPKSVEKSKKDNPVKSIYKSRGLKGTVDVFFELLKVVVSKLKWLTKRLKIRNFKLSLPVGGGDAADIAIKYGAVCSALYPAVAFADANLNFKYKKIDVYADFEGNAPNFSISVDIGAEIIVLLVFAIGCLVEFYKFYKNIKPDIKDKKVNEERMSLNERKQY